MILHLPENHQTSVIAKERAGWLRCRLVEAPPDVPTYVESPTVINVEAHTIGGTAPTVNAEVVRGEIVGRSRARLCPTWADCGRRLGRSHSKRLIHSWWKWGAGPWYPLA